MTDDPNDPEVLFTAANEPEAASVIAALAEHGVEAFGSGGLAFAGTIGLDGGVEVMVKRAELDRARQALAEIREEDRQIDWSQIDTSESGASDPPAE
jgi:hypothetical protein